MLLTKVVLNDLGVYRGRNEFDFKTTQEKPVILIGGTNGAGKTTLFESVMLCLYGQDSFEEKKSKKEYQAIIGRSIHRYLGVKKSAEEASVVIEFQFSHEGKIDEFQVIRMWQNNDGKIDETLTIKKKNSTEEEFTELDSVEKNDWQVFIDQLIPRGIVKLFFFDGEKIQNIAESENEEKHIKTSFDTLLGLDLVKQLGDDIGRTLIRNSKGETKEIEQAIDDNIEERKMREADIEKNKEKIVELNAKIKTLTVQSQNLQDDFNKIGGNFAKILFVVIILGGFGYLGSEIMDIYKRDNMNFDEYEFSFDAAAAKAALADANANKNANAGACMNGSCCADGTTFSYDVHKCIPDTTSGDSGASPTTSGSPTVGNAEGFTTTGHQNMNNVTKKKEGINFSNLF